MLAVMASAQKVSDIQFHVRRSASGRNPAFVNTHLESVNRIRGKKKPNASDSSQGSKNKRSRLQELGKASPSSSCLEKIFR